MLASRQQRMIQMHSVCLHDKFSVEGKWNERISSEFQQSMHRHHELLSTLVESLTESNFMQMIQELLPKTISTKGICNCSIMLLYCNSCVCQSLYSVIGLSSSGSWRWGTMYRERKRKHCETWTSEAYSHRWLYNTLRSYRHTFNGRMRNGQ